MKSGTLTCAEQDGSQDVVVRGAPSGMATQLANLRGWVAGVETIDGADILDIEIQNLGPLEQRVSPEAFGPSTESKAYAALRGLSGGPVCVAGGDGRASVIAVVSRRNAHGIASRLYAVPITAARSFLAASGFTLHVTRQASDRSTALDIFAGRLVTRLARNSVGEHDLWNDASELFYSGVPMDAILGDMIATPERYGLRDPLAIARTEYLFGRLQLKRGNVTQGVNVLRKARARIQDARTVEGASTAALIDLRLLIDNNQDKRRPVSERRFSVEKAFDAVGEIASLPLDHRAYEIASAAGHEAMEVLNGPAVTSPNDTEGRYFTALAEQHKVLTSEYAESLRDKQEIVGIWLDILASLWGLDGLANSDRIDRLSELTQHGRIAAAQRQNAIFYCQMILLEGMLAHVRGSEDKAVTLVLTSTEVLRSSGLTLEHEGVSSISHYLKKHDQELLRLMTMAHEIDSPTDLLSAFSNSGSRYRQLLSNGVQMSRGVIDTNSGLGAIFSVDPSSV